MYSLPIWIVRQISLYRLSSLLHEIQAPMRAMRIEVFLQALNLRMT